MKLAFWHSFWKAESSSKPKIHRKSASKYIFFTSFYVYLPFRLLSVIVEGKNGKHFFLYWRMENIESSKPHASSQHPRRLSRLRSNPASSRRLHPLRRQFLVRVGRLQVIAAEHAWLRDSCRASPRPRASSPLVSADAPPPVYAGAPPPV